MFRVQLAVYAFGLLPKIKSINLGIGSGNDFQFENLDGREPPNTVCSRLVGFCAFSGSLRGVELIPAKWRSLIPPTSG